MSDASESLHYPERSSGTTMASQRSYSLQEKASILAEIDSRGLPQLCHVARDLQMSISSLSRILKEREAITRALARAPSIAKAGEPVVDPCVVSRCSRVAKACASRLRKFLCLTSAPTKVYTRGQKALVEQHVEAAGGRSKLRDVSERLGISISSLSLILKERRNGVRSSLERPREDSEPGKGTWCCGSVVPGWWSRLKTRWSRESLSGQRKGAIGRQIERLKCVNLRELSDGLSVSISTLSRILKERERSLRLRECGV